MKACRLVNQFPVGSLIADDDLRPVGKLLSVNEDSSTQVENLQTHQVETWPKSVIGWPTE
jgi:hypothetical protein